MKLQLFALLIACVVPLMVVEAIRSSSCEEPLKIGPCRALIPRWGFDRKVGKCVRFMYGGCLPNDNNFHDRIACQIKCDYHYDAIETADQRNDVDVESLPEYYS